MTLEKITECFEDFFEIYNVTEKDKAELLSRLGDLAEREQVLKYLAARKKTITASIAAEKLAGNEVKLQCERTALAEVEGIEKWIVDPTTDKYRIKT